MEKILNLNQSDKNSETTNASQISENMNREFETLDLPFFGCDFDTVYPTIQSLLPKESITFDKFGDSVAIMCEIICASICHKIN